MVRGRKFNRLKNWMAYPRRRARNAAYECRLCQGALMHGQDYHDAGNGVRVCVPCAEITTDLWRESQARKL